jgi:quinol-cytochrome oxidoreductase complex cytochrome b subunit
MSASPATDPPPARRGLVGWLEERVNLTEIFSFLTHFGLVFTPVDTRRPLRDVTAEIARQPVPSYARGPRVLGLLAAILFGVEAVTGVLLAYYYRPTPEAAFESTRTIVRDLPFGWLLHQIHSWGAWMLIAVVVLRLLRLFWDGLYRAPRELLWMTAVAMAWVALQLDFTGRLLLWDTRSYWSAVRGIEVVFALPVVGPVLAFLLGGRAVNDDVLIRFYVLHVVVLPVLYASLIYLTIATIRRVGLSPERVGASGVTTTYRDHLYAMIILLVLAFGALVTLAVLVPFRFLSAADPYSTPAGVHPPWYMLAPYAVQHVARVPLWAGGGLLVAAAFAVLLLPFLLRGRFEGGAGRVRVWGVAALVVWIGLSLVALGLDRR